MEKAGVDGLPPLPERGTRSISSLDHLDFHLFNQRITERFLFPMCQALCWMLGCGYDHNLLPLFGGSLGTWEVSVLTGNCAVAGVMEREALGALASREGQTNQTGFSNIWNR